MAVRQHYGSVTIISLILLIFILLTWMPSLYVLAQQVDPEKQTPSSFKDTGAMSRHVKWTTGLSLVSAIKTISSDALSILFEYRIVTFLGLVIPGAILLCRRSWQPEKPSSSKDDPGEISDTIGIDAITTDPGLLKKHSEYAAYSVPATGITYPSIRTVYRPHPQGDKLPTDPAPIPLLVFIHGLGGSIAQFHPLLTSLVNCADSLAVDLPGCGLSRFSPRSWNAYTTDSLAHLLAVIIEKYRNKDAGQGVVLICHSMGCSLGALLSSTTSPYADLIAKHVLGFIVICPVAEPPSKEEAAKFRKLLHIPGPIFDLWRRYDRRGGTESSSVARFAGLDAEEETKKLQVRFNEQSRTPVWRRMAYGALPSYIDGEAKGGLPGRKIWSGLVTPTFLVAGEADPITKAGNVHKIVDFLGQGAGEQVSVPVANAKSSNFAVGHVELTSHTVGNTQPVGDKQLRILILPAPASHALLYAPRTARPLSGHIQTFLANSIDRRLSLGWQLQHLSTEGKWDVKNFQKWQAVQTVSLPINDMFRAMKTLREVDGTHSPKIFVEEWAAGSSRNGKDGLGSICAVVDISHESPVYDPRGLERGGIVYRKFPTVSKVPPTIDEIKSFITIIDELRDEFVSMPNSDQREEDAPHHPYIAVHCHYGFNRTGFFIVSYMVEKLGFKLTQALKVFAAARPPGVRHSYFVDELYARYWTGDEAGR